MRSNAFFDHYAGLLIEELARRAIDALPGGACRFINVRPDVLRASITDPSLECLGDRELQTVAVTVALQLRRRGWPHE